MGYIQLYLYRIPHIKREEFLDIMRKVREIYRKYGVDGEELFLLTSKTTKYGLTGLWQVLPPKEEEEIWLGIDRYKNAKHCEAVMKKIDADREIDQLYEQFIQLVDSVSRVVQGEFEQVVY